MTRVSSPKRLVFFIQSMGGGGAERVTANLANFWADQGWDITVVTLAPVILDFYELHPAVKRLCLNLTGESRHVVMGFGQNLRRVMAMRRVLQELAPEIALAVMTGANVRLALAAWGLPVLAVGSEHVHPPQFPLGFLWEVLRRYSYGRLNAVAALTSESSEWLQTHTTAKQVVVIPNAAPWPLPAQDPKMSPKSIRVDGRKILLGVGRLVAEKGFDLLIHAFALLANKHQDWDLVILGEGLQRPMIENIVKTTGLEDRVFLPGSVNNVGEWYERADIYVMSSRFEGFGNALAEALAHGLPAVSFDCDTGPRNIIRHERDGLLAAPEDITGLALALDRLMADAGLREQFTCSAIEARERFSIKRVTGMWEDLFDKAAKACSSH